MYQWYRGSWWLHSWISQSLIDGDSHLSVTKCMTSPSAYITSCSRESKLLCQNMMEGKSSSANRGKWGINDGGINWRWRGRCNFWLKMIHECSFRSFLHCAINMSEREWDCVSGYVQIDHVPNRLPPLYHLLFKVCVYLLRLGLCLPASDANVSRFCRGILISKQLGYSMHSQFFF